MKPCRHLLLAMQLLLLHSVVSNAANSNNGAVSSDAVVVLNASSADAAARLLLPNPHPSMEGNSQGGTSPLRQLAVWVCPAGAARVDGAASFVRVAEDAAGAFGGAEIFSGEPSLLLRAGVDVALNPPHEAAAVSARMLLGGGGGERVVFATATEKERRVGIARTSASSFEVVWTPAHCDVAATDEGEEQPKKQKKQQKQREAVHRVVVEEATGDEGDAAWSALCGRAVGTEGQVRRSDGTIAQTVRGLAANKTFWVSVVAECADGAFAAYLPAIARTVDTAPLACDGRELRGTLAAGQWASARLCVGASSSSSSRGEDDVLGKQVRVELVTERGDADLVLSGSMPAQVLSFQRPAAIPPTPTSSGLAVYSFGSAEQIDVEAGAMSVGPSSECAAVYFLTVHSPHVESEFRLSATVEGSTTKATTTTEEEAEKEKSSSKAEIAWMVVDFLLELLGAVFT